MTIFSKDAWLVACLALAAGASYGYFYSLGDEGLVRLGLIAPTADVQLATTIGASYPSLHAMQGLSDPTLAFGIDGTSDWGEVKYLDIMKQGRSWIGHSASEWGAMDADAMQKAGILDEHGWVKSIPSNLTSIGNIFAWDGNNEYGQGNDRVGRYVLTYEGEGTLHLSLVNSSAIESEVPGKIVFSLSASQGGWGIELTATDPNHTGNYIRNIKIVREEYMDLYNAGELFDPRWIAHLKDARLIRLMDVMGTNGSTITTWDQYPKVDYYNWTVMPVEVMVRLANEVGADPWFNMPFSADDDFSRQFATYVKGHLNPKLVANVELSNEVWNWSFKQAQDSHQAGIALWHLDPNNAGAAWVNYYGMRASQVMKIWSDVYGSETATRLKRLAGVQTAYTALTNEILLAPMWQAADPSHYVKPATYFDAIAATTYFGGDYVTQAAFRDYLNKQVATGKNEMDVHRDMLMKPYPVTGTVSVLHGDRTVTGIGTNFLSELPPYGLIVINGATTTFTLSNSNSDTVLKLDQGWPGMVDATNASYQIYDGDGIVITLENLKTQKAIAAANNLTMVAYEGGQHVHHSAFVNVDDATLAAMQTHLINFVRSSQMAELYHALWNEWMTVGDGPFMQFGDMGIPSKYGSWGERASYTDNPPRASLLDQLNSATSHWWNESRQSGAFLQGVQETGTDNADTITGTNGVDYLIGKGGDDTFYPGPGDDGVNGGDGTDTVLFKGTQSQYTVTRKGDGYQVVGPDGTDYLYDVEILQFEDVSQTVDGVTLTSPTEPVPPTKPVPPTIDPTPSTPSTPQGGTSTGTPPLETGTPQFTDGQLLMLTAAAPLYQNPADTVLKILPANTYVKVKWSGTVVAGTVWYRVTCGDNCSGYITESVAKAAPTPTRTEGVGDTTLLYNNVKDLNKDGVDDDVQARVVSLVKKDDSNGELYNALELKKTNSVITKFVNEDEAKVKPETAYTYPVGLYDFAAKVTSGTTETVKIYLDAKYDTSQWQYRKYNGNTYVDMSSSVTYGTAVIGTTEVTTVSYPILDNGPLDTDTRLGYIADPAGPAIPVALAPSVPATTPTPPVTAPVTTPTTPQSTPKTSTLVPRTSVTTTIPAGFTFRHNLSFTQPQLNSADDVKNLEQFLNDYNNEHLPITAVYNAADVEAMKRFQQKYQHEILGVWNLPTATGYVGLTTRLKMNFLLKGSSSVCPAFTEFNGGKNGVNISAEIGKTQAILTELGMYSGPQNNTWDAGTNKALITFQQTFHEVMLDPWHLAKGTGYKYKTTNKFLNYFAGCDTGEVYLEGVGSYGGI